MGVLSLSLSLAGPPNLEAAPPQPMGTGYSVFPRSFPHSASTNTSSPHTTRSRRRGPTDGLTAWAGPRMDAIRCRPRVHAGRCAQGCPASWARGRLPVSGSGCLGLGVGAGLIVRHLGGASNPTNPSAQARPGPGGVAIGSPRSSSIDRLFWAGSWSALPSAARTLCG